MKLLRALDIHVNSSVRQTLLLGARTDVLLLRSEPALSAKGGNWT